MNRPTTEWVWIARPGYSARHATPKHALHEARRPDGTGTVLTECGLQLPTDRPAERKHTTSPVKICERCRQLVWEAATLADFAANAA